MKPIRFMHISDQHFGAGRRLSKNSTDKLDYLKRHVSIWNSYIDLAKDKKCDFYVSAGDIFEGINTSIEEFVAAAEWFERMGKVCPGIATAGNHDEEQIGVFQNRFLNRLPISNTTFVDRPRSFGWDGSRFLEDFDEAVVRILACPWVGLKEQDEFDEWIGKYYGGEQIVMLHECFKGIVTDTGYKALKGVQVPDLRGARYFACGDIHKHQRLNLPHAWYSGAGGQYNFGDKPDKGCMIVDIDAEGNYSWEFVPVKSAIELHIAYSVQEITNPNHWYQLRIPGNQIPEVLPPNVRDLQPLSPKLDAVVADHKAGSSNDVRVVEIDYHEGVRPLLTQGQYEETEIVHTEEEISSVLKQHGYVDLKAQTSQATL